VVQTVKQRQCKPLFAPIWLKLLMFDQKHIRQSTTIVSGSDPVRAGPSRWGAQCKT